MDSESWLKKNGHTVYKYRGWIEEEHKSLLTDSQIWFGHPHKLNDIKDIRPDLFIDYNEIPTIACFKWVCYLLSADKSLSEKELYKKADKKWNEFKNNPSILKDNLLDYYADYASLNNYGVFSTAKNALSDQLWMRYGNRHKGYCIGFDAFSLYKDTNTYVNSVLYSNKPYPITFKGEALLKDFGYLFYKKLKWSYEEEVRFLVNQSAVYNRLKSFNPDSVREIILGHQVSKIDQEEIIDTVRSKYRHNPPIYQVKFSNGTLKKGLLIP